MVKIDKVKIPDARVLTPMEMNKVHFASGKHSELSDAVPRRKQEPVED